ncbi:MAG: two-component regulator propeller domain-containing protein [Bacteroidota bacterium]
MTKAIFIISLSILLLSGNRIFAQVFTNYFVADGLPENFICGGVAVDGNNVKWFGTSAGIARFDDVTWTSYTTADGLVDNYTTCIAADINDNIWIGTNMGLSRFDGTTWTTFTTADGLPDNTINYVTGDSNGNVWICTFAGLVKFDGSTWTTYTASDGLSSELISYTREDGFGNLWIGTWAGGIIKYNGSSFSVFNMASTDSLMDDNITTIAITDDGHVWAGSIYGLTVLDTAGNWIENIRADGGLYNEYIMDLAVDNDGHLWVGSFIDYLIEGGISNFNGTGWSTFDVTDGLADSQIERIAVDQNNILWIATGYGVSRFDIALKFVLPEINELNAYPNPASGIINFPGTKQPAGIELVNSAGTVVYSGLPADNRLDVSDFPAGIYILCVSEECNTTRSKIIIY